MRAREVRGRRNTLASITHILLSNREDRSRPVGVAKEAVGVAKEVVGVAKESVGVAEEHMALAKNSTISLKQRA